MLCTLSSVRAERREPAGPRSLALVRVSAGIVPRSGVAACVHGAFSLLPLSSDRTRSLSALLLRLSMVRLAACRVVGLARRGQPLWPYRIAQNIVRIGGGSRRERRHPWRTEGLRQAEDRVGAAREPGRARC